MKYIIRNQREITKPLIINELILHIFILIKKYVLEFLQVHVFVYIHKHSYMLQYIFVYVYVILMYNI